MSGRPGHATWLDHSVPEGGQATCLLKLPRKHYLRRRATSTGEPMQHALGPHSSSDGLPPRLALVGAAASGLPAALALAAFGFSASRARFGAFPASGTCGMHVSSFSAFTSIMQ